VCAAADPFPRPTGLMVKERRTGDVGRVLYLPGPARPHPLLGPGDLPFGVDRVGAGSCTSPASPRRLSGSAGRCGAAMAVSVGAARPPTSRSAWTSTPTAPGCGTRSAAAVELRRPWPGQADLVFRQRRRTSPLVDGRTATRSACFAEGVHTVVVHRRFEGRVLGDRHRRGPPAGVPGAGGRPGWRRGDGVRRRLPWPACWDELDEAGPGCARRLPPPAICVGAEGRLGRSAYDRRAHPGQLRRRHRSALIYPVSGIGRYSDQYHSRVLSCGNVIGRWVAARVAQHQVRAARAGASTLGVRAQPQ